MIPIDADHVGRVYRVGDHIDTDAILPGRYLALREPAELGRHCFESLDPEFCTRVKTGDILVAGRNFGCGSSREHAPIALLAAGIRAVIAASAARIFYRNAINLGLPVLISPDASMQMKDGEPASIRLSAGLIRQGDASWRADPLDGEVAAILAAGGLVERIRRRLANNETRGNDHG